MYAGGFAALAAGEFCSQAPQFWDLRIQDLEDLVVNSTRILNKIDEVERASAVLVLLFAQATAGVVRVFAKGCWTTFRGQSNVEKGAASQTAKPITNCSGCGRSARLLLHAKWPLLESWPQTQICIKHVMLSCLGTFTGVYNLNTFGLVWTSVSQYFDQHYLCKIRNPEAQPGQHLFDSALVCERGWKAHRQEDEAGRTHWRTGASMLQQPINQVSLFAYFRDRSVQVLLVRANNV